MKRVKWMTAVIMILLMVMPLSVVKAANDDYQIEISVTENPDNKCYEISLEIYNAGKNFTGSVMISVGKSYYDNSKYVTPVSLSEKSTKTVSFKVPIAGVVDPDFNVEVDILNGKGKSIFSKNYPRPLAGGNSGYQIGVLSDTPEALSWFDLGGKEVALQTGTYTLKLNELSASNIVSELPNQKAVIIDNYDTTALGDDAIKEIEKFVDKGGVLFICTGSNEKTLLGFDNKFTGVVAGGHGTVTYYGNSDVDLISTDLNLAPVSNAVPFSTYLGEGGFMNYYGGGCVVNLVFSLRDPGFDNFDALVKESFVTRLLYDSYSNTNFVMGNKDINFEQGTLNYNAQYMEKPSGKGLTGIIVPLMMIYIVIVGPLLYLILKKIGKREKCWLVIPAVSMGFTLVLFLLSFAFSVKKASIKTISLIEAGGDSVETAVTGYSPGSEEWNMLMKDNYYSGYKLEHYSDSDDRIMFSGDGVAINCKPSSVFEEKYFVMYGNCDRAGYFNENGTITDAGGYHTGTVKNDTGMDFDYVLIVYGNCTTLIGEVKNGESADIQQKKIVGSATSYSSGYTVLRNEVQKTYSSGDYVKAAELASLSIAQEALFYNSGTSNNLSNPVIIGVKKSDNVMLHIDNGEESSFTCVYMK